MIGKGIEYHIIANENNSKLSKTCAGELKMQYVI